MQKPKRYRVVKVDTEMQTDEVEHARFASYTAHVEVNKRQTCILTFGPCLSLEELLQQVLDTLGYQP